MMGMLLIMAQHYFGTRDLRTSRLAVFASLALFLAAGSGTALAKRKPKGLIEQVEQAVSEHHSYEVPAAGTS